MFSWLTKKTTVPARTNRTTLAVEQLEARNLMAANNYFILDFTPDYHAGSFVDTFNTVRYSNGLAPRFLDFNRDGFVSSADAPIAAAQIASKVQSFFQPFVNNRANHLQIRYGDVTQNQNLGYEWMKYGRAYNSVNVAVMYIGGTSGQGANVLGIAPLAANGSNIEGYGETYSRTLANGLLRKANATTTDFVNSVAQTVAHEFGHMMGLRHTTFNDGVNIMNPNQSATPGSTRFVFGAVNTSNGYRQDAYKELDASFQTNQTQVFGRITDGRFLHAHAEDGHEDRHEHEHEHEAMVGPGNQDTFLTPPRLTEADPSLSIALPKAGKIATAPANVITDNYFATLAGATKSTGGATGEKTLPTTKSLDSLFSAMKSRDLRDSLASLKVEGNLAL